MWQLADAHYVHDVGAQRQPSNLAKSLLILGVLGVMVTSSIFGLMQISRVISVATSAMPGFTLPTKPTLSSAVLADSARVGLSTAIEEWIKAHPDHNWSVAVQEISPGGQSVSVSNRPYGPASLYKILLLPAFFEQYSLEDLDSMQISGQSLRSCFEKMLLQSDNVCGEAIANELVGWASIDKTLDSFGYSSLKLNNPQGMTVTADDMVQFMADLYAGKLTDKPVRDYVLSLLEKQSFRSGIPAGCKDCVVMNKTGDKSVRHDVAIIEDNGRTYALGIFSDGGSYAEIAELAGLVQKNLR